MDLLALDGRTCSVRNTIKIVMMSGDLVIVITIRLLAFEPWTCPLEFGPC